MAREVHDYMHDSDDDSFPDSDAELPTSRQPSERARIAKENTASKCRRQDGTLSPISQLRRELDGNSLEKIKSSSNTRTKFAKSMDAPMSTREQTCELNGLDGDLALIQKSAKRRAGTLEANKKRTALRTKTISKAKRTTSNETTGGITIGSSTSRKSPERNSLETLQEKIHNDNEKDSTLTEEITGNRDGPSAIVTRSRSQKDSFPTRIEHSTIPRKHGSRLPKPEPKNKSQQVSSNRKGDLMKSDDPKVKKRAGGRRKSEGQLRKFIFLNLPPEQRNQIYEYLVEDKNKPWSIHLVRDPGAIANHLAGRGGDGSLTEQKWIRDDSWSFTQTCRQIRHEFEPILRNGSTKKAYILLPDIVEYLNTFHPAQDAEDPDKRRGGAVEVMWDEKNKKHGLLEKPVDVLPLAKIVNASPELRLDYSEIDDDCPWWADVFDNNYDDDFETPHIYTTQIIVESYPLWGYHATRVHGVTEICVSSCPTKRLGYLGRAYDQIIEMKSRYTYTDVAWQRRDALSIFKCMRPEIEPNMTFRTGLYLRYNSPIPRVLGDNTFRFRERQRAWHEVGRSRIRLYVFLWGAVRIDKLSITSK
jgi:hypothetical protein